MIMPKLSIRHFFAKENFPRHPLFFESATGNSWKQLGLVPLTRQKTSYLKPRVSDYDRDPSRRSPPRGRCKCTFSLQVGLGKLSQSVDWPLSQIATVGGRLNDCENFKKTLVGVQWYSVHVSQTALPFPACRNPGSPTPKTKASGVATFPLGTRPSPSQKGEDPRVP